MDYNTVKNLIRSYLGDIVDTKELEYLFVDNPNIYYKCSDVTWSKGFTHLHKCVMLTNKYPNLDDYLEEYLKKYGNVDQVNDELWSALHLASYNSRTFSSERTVEILINANANVNLQNNWGCSALHYASLYSETDSTKRTVEILISADADVFNLKNINNETPYDYLSKKLKEHLQIDKATQTIGILQGKLTKCAKK